MQVDSDSSEEDEDISSSVPVKNERKSFPVKKAAKAILISTVEDEEEYDEPLPAPVEEPAAVADVVAKKTAATAAVPAAICSTECSEALAALSLDNWDVSSWMVLLEEVEQGRGGSMSVIDAYNKILKQFPRAARFWKRLAEHLLKKKDSDSLETLFDEAAERCRSVELWLLYLQFIRSTLVDASLNQSEEYFANRRTTELAYERAIDNVGRAIDSYPIWRKYLDTVRSWTDAGKVAAMRKIYQRAVCVPMDNMEEIWNEYEAFEKQYSDAMAEQVLSEFQKKHLHAKSIYRDRKKLADPIIFDRLATPPLNNSAEIRQLHVWNSWLK